MKEEAEAAKKAAKEAGGATVEEIKEGATETQAKPVVDAPKPVEKKPVEPPKPVSAAVENMAKMSTYNGAELKDYSWAQTAFETSA